MFIFQTYSLLTGLALFSEKIKNKNIKKCEIIWSDKKKNVVGKRKNQNYNIFYFRYFSHLISSINYQ